MKKILFVCLGNICRSAAAEAVLKKAAQDRGVSGEYEIDSAGISGYHAGERADKRMIEAALGRGYRVTSVSRPVTSGDLEHFDCIIAMDNHNVRDLKRMARTEEQKKKIRKLTDFSSVGFRQKYGMTEVPDPYYGGAAGFTLVLDMLEDAAGGILNDLCRKSAGVE